MGAGRGTAKEIPQRAFNDLIQRAIAAGQIAADDSTIWRADHAVRFTPHQQIAVDRTLARFAAAPYAPPTAAETLTLLGNDEALLEALIDQTQLTRLSGGVLFRHADFEAMIEGVRDYLAEHGVITLAQARDLFDTSRKYGQALLEEMDARHITRRNGDERVLR